MGDSDGQTELLDYKFATLANMSWFIDLFHIYILEESFAFVIGRPD